MKLTLLDLSIILAYLLATVVIGLVLKKVAQKSKSAYLLGGNRLPWYLLGLSNASGMFDISGTMWLIAIGFVYGLKAIWLPWLWPVFNQIFLMVYLSMWLRRSNVTTGAEWIATRFGTGRDPNLAHGVVVIFALIGCIGMLAYGFIGIGKFVEIFVPWEFLSAYLPFDIPEKFVPHFYGIILTLFAMFYSIIGGMVSIVWADVLQYLIMTVASIFVAIIAMRALADAGGLTVPAGWLDPFFGWQLQLDWSGIVQEADQKITEDGYSLFTIFFMLMVFKGMLVSAAGPAPNYDMQKILATKSPREAALMSGFVSVILMPIRYLMITGFVVLALLYYDQLDLLVPGKSMVDFEQILPSAMEQFIPAGLLGLLLAGLFAAFNSTFAGTLNAGQAYLVNDIYLKYIRPQASNRATIRMNYIVGVVLVVISTIFGFFAKDVNDILQWVVSGLWGGYIAANVLKWYWWRFNALGYFCGMATGTAAALIFPLVFSGLDLYYFPLLLLISTLGCIVGTYQAPPTDEKVLMDFYASVRPWGIWKPIHEKVLGRDPSFQANRDFGRDMFNVLLGIIWQTALVALPIYVVVLRQREGIIALVIVLLTSFILKRTWLDKLPKNT